MKRRVRDDRGIALIEVLVGMSLLLLVIMGAATVVAAGAKMNADNKERQRAMALVQAQIDRLRSLDYREIGMVPVALTTAAGAPGGDGDVRRTERDWRDLYCPLPSGCANGNPHLVALHSRVTGFAVPDPKDPRIAKRWPDLGDGPLPATSPAATSSYTSNGITLYTYVYWGGEAYPADPTATTAEFKPELRQWKVAVVIGKYRDPLADHFDASGLLTEQGVNYTTVRQTQVIADAPGLNQIPTS